MDWECAAQLIRIIFISPTCGNARLLSSQLGALLEVIGTAILLELLSLAREHLHQWPWSPSQLGFLQGLPKFQSSQVVKN